jgi:nicotinamide-nucleotide amidase
MTDSSDSITTEVDAIAARALAGGWHLAVAESLTGGELAARLARGKNADEWFRGGIVAYQPRVKAELLGVDGPPVVTEEAARQMARAASVMFHAELAVALTGEAGPVPDENVPPGTVWIGISEGGIADALMLDFTGDPDDVVAQSVREALRVLCNRLDR